MRSAARADAPVPSARTALDLARAAELVLAAIADRHPFDPRRLDARDPELVAALLPLFERIATSYLRVEVEGLEHVGPRQALYVGNHNGGILGPDLFCTLAMLWRRLGPRARLYALAHDFAMRHILPLGRVLARLGALEGRPVSAHRALASGASVLVYPGGDLDAFRSFAQRDRIVFGERAGFVRLARSAGVPIVPIVAHGAHRSCVIVHEGAWLARALGLRRACRLARFPIALGLPWGVGLGPWVPYFPLPFQVRLRVLAPIDVPPDAGVEATRALVVDRMQGALEAMAARA